jgi:transposase
VTLPEAQRRVWVCRLTGWAIVVVAGVVVAFIFLKHAYLNLPGGLLFQVPGRKLRKAIDGILDSYPVVSFFWVLIPTGDHQFIYFVLMSVFIWVAVGAMIIRRGEILSGRIRRARQRVEEARWQDVPERFPPYQPCHRRFQHWVRDGTLCRVLAALAEDLWERGELDLSAWFMDGTCIVAKTGAQEWEDPSGAKARSSWQWQTARVFLSPSTRRLRRRMPSP